jgi:hypothetical protein
MRLPMKKTQPVKWLGCNHLAMVCQRGKPGGDEESRSEDTPDTSAGLCDT